MRSILNKLFLWQKFTILGVFAALLITIPFSLYLKETTKSIDATRLESAGMAPTKATLRAMQLTQQHRGLSAQVLGGNTAAQSQRAAKADETSQAYSALEALIKQTGNPALADSWTQTKNSWTGLASKIAQGGLSGKDSFAEHSALVAQLLKINGLLLDHFGLSLDPELESYYLMDAGLIQFPALAEALGKIRGKGTAILAAKTVEPTERVVVEAMIDKANDRYEGLVAGLAKVAEADPALKAKLAAQSTVASSAASKALQLAQAQIVKADTLVLSSADYMSQFTSAIDEQFKLDDVILTELNQMLSARDAKLSNTRLAVSGALLLITLLASAFSFLIIRSISGPLLQAVTLARCVADGDLTSNICVDSNNETGKLLQALRDMNQSLVKIVGEVRSGTDTIATASGQIASGNLDLSSRTEQQASSLEETASSMEELTSTVKQNADNARQANQLAVTASTIASQGGAVVAQVIDTMGSINASAKKIVDIISVIDGIAFQTNILALNAAVEAARAGEQGRGFAVVAAEVRNLAQRSASAAKEINSLISDSVEKVDAGSKLVDQAGATMTQVVDSVKRVTDIISEITAASSEQSAGIEQINQAITEMDNVTQQNAALVEEAAAAASSLQDQAGRLAEVVSVFKLEAGVRKMVAPTTQPAMQAQKLPPKPASKPVSKPALKPAPRSVRQPAFAGAAVAAKSSALMAEGDWETF